MNEGARYQVWLRILTDICWGLDRSSQTTPRSLLADPYGDTLLGPGQKPSSNPGATLGPAEVALLLENVRMREEREQLHCHLHSITERVSHTEVHSRSCDAHLHHMPQHCASANPVEATTMHVIRVGPQDMSWSGVQCLESERSIRPCNCKESPIRLIVQSAQVH